MGRKVGARHGPKIGGGLLCFFRGWGAVSSTQCGLAEAYLSIKWHFDPSTRLATTYMGGKLGAVPFWEGGTGPHLTQCGVSRGLPPY